MGTPSFMFISDVFFDQALVFPWLRYKVHRALLLQVAASFQYKPIPLRIVAYREYRYQQKPLSYNAPWVLLKKLLVSFSAPSSSPASQLFTSRLCNPDSPSSTFTKKSPVKRRGKISGYYTENCKNQAYAILIDHILPSPSPSKPAIFFLH